MQQLAMASHSETPDYGAVRNDTSIGEAQSDACTVLISTVDSSLMKRLLNFEAHLFVYEPLIAPVRHENKHST